MCFQKLIAENTIILRYMYFHKLITENTFTYKRCVLVIELNRKFYICFLFFYGNSYKTILLV